MPEAFFDTLDDVLAERARQLAKPQRVELESPYHGEAEKYLVLAEEVGEVARALHEGQPVAELRVELIQVAAVAAAWASGLERPPVWTPVEGGVSTTEPF